MPSHKEGGVSITSQAKSSFSIPIIYRAMDTVQEALCTCHSFLSQLWVDHYSHSKSRPYVDLGLYDAAMEVCFGMLELTLEHIIHQYKYQSDHW